MSILKINSENFGSYGNEEEIAGYIEKLCQIILIYIFIHIYSFDYINIWTKINKTHKILCSLILDLVSLAVEFNCFTKSLFFILTSLSEWMLTEYIV